MKFLTIEIPEAHDKFGYFDVVDEQGRRCDGLSWDEMLGQVAMLTIPPGRVGHGFGMRTPFEWATMRAESAKRRGTARMVVDAQFRDPAVDAPLETSEAEAAPVALVHGRVVRISDPALVAEAMEGDKGLRIIRQVLFGDDSHGGGT